MPVLKAIIVFYVCASKQICFSISMAPKTLATEPWLNVRGPKRRHCAEFWMINEELLESMVSKCFSHTTPGFAWAVRASPLPGKWQPIAWKMTGFDSLQGLVSRMYLAVGAVVCFNVRRLTLHGWVQLVALLWSGSFVTPQKKKFFSHWCSKRKVLFTLEIHD